MRLGVTRHWSIAIALTAALASAANAQTAQTGPTALSFDAAQLRFDRRSRAISAADHGVDAAKAGADAVRTLHRPIVTASAQYLVYQKTLSVDVTGEKSAALGNTQDFLAAFPGSVPPAFQQIASEISGRLSQALPGLFDAIPDQLSYRFRDEVFRPTVQAALPIYTGGAIPAVQRAAQGGVAMAEGRRAQVVDLARLNLIRAYFGQQAAAGLLEAARRSRDALDKIVSDSRKLEAAGVIPHARTLEVQVARDTAERTYQRAELSSATARDELARLLDLDTVVPTTALFVQTRPLAPVETFLGSEGSAPEARTADAGRQIADAGVALARSRRLPQAYAFGEYNLNRSNALPIEPDWIAGVGVRYTILSNIDRRRTEDAARAQAAAAADTAAEARRIATSATIRAYNLVEGARRSFVLLDSSIAAARENVRVQSVAFREGEGTATPVIAAQAALDTAEAQRIAVAYEYDLALAGLLASASRLDAFGSHLARADQRLVYGTGQ
ncbi:outer membrane protein TolC [Sphingomonas aurantiaca]|uniref:Outer membrane protein TolC n=1 Tax=Sphingomonas aurantiaca TaxID=185949 RepID=A0A2T5GGQ2_9SPHN|nr:TolC family protein [Sphingomonas aurantiaca]PTQ58505.1 outer membrane protein TolC [Sphingomonas aurantiaca]